MNSMNKSETINSIVKLLRMIGIILFTVLTHLRKWLFKSGRSWFDIFVVSFFAIVIVLMVAVMGWAIAQECYNDTCKIERQKAKVELWLTLVNDCTERGIATKVCEDFALQTIGDD